MSDLVTVHLDADDADLVGRELLELGDRYLDQAGAGDLPTLRHAGVVLMHAGRQMLIAAKLQAQGSGAPAGGDDRG